MSDDQLRKMYQAVHAGLLNQARALQAERAAILQQAAALEQAFNFKGNASVKLEKIDGASYAGMVSVVEGLTTQE